MNCMESHSRVGVWWAGGQPSEAQAGQGSCSVSAGLSVRSVEGRKQLGSGLASQAGFGSARALVLPYQVSPLPESGRWHVAISQAAFSGADLSEGSATRPPVLFPRSLPHDTHTSRGHWSAGAGAGLPFVEQLIAWAGVLRDEAKAVTNLGHAAWEQSSELEAGGEQEAREVEGAEGPRVRRASSVSASLWPWGGGQ